MRLFAAAVPDQAALTSLAETISPLRSDDVASGFASTPNAYQNLHWISQDRWHITLVFFDEVTESRIPRLVQLLGTTIPEFSRLTLQISGLTPLPSRGRPRMFWSGVTGEVDQLAVVVRAIQRVARQMKIPIEQRTFQPHITLGRWRPRDALATTQATQLPKEIADYSGPQFSINEIVLMKSELGPRPEYEVIASWPLLPK